MEFVDNDPENPHINYFRNPVSGVSQLEKLMNTVEGKLKNIVDPVLVIQGKNDPVVNPASGRDIYKKVGSRKKKYNAINADHHGILRGEEAGEVTTKVLDFLNDAF